MRLSKRELVESLNLECGGYSPMDRTVCTACVSDPFLAAILAAEAYETPCSYCGSPNSTEIEILLDELSLALQLDYIDPANELPYESREGGYIGEVLSGSEIVANELGSWTEVDQLLDEVAAAFADSFWCKRNYFGLDQLEIFKYGWQHFSTQAKHRSRFLLLPDPAEEPVRADEIPPSKMLQVLCEIFHEFSLFSIEGPGAEFVRARVVNGCERPATAKELGTAPREKAQASRMSPAGIAMFYAAYDEDTAVSETFDPNRRRDHRTIALARFRTLRPLTFLDLTNLPAVPSLFDFESRPERLSIASLRMFERDFTRPIERDDRVHTEYVPTQIVTEYVRYQLRAPGGEAIDGVAYASARDKGGKALVVFAEPGHCGPRPDRHWFEPKPFLELTSVRYAQPEEFKHLWSEKGDLFGRGR